MKRTLILILILILLGGIAFIATKKNGEQTNSTLGADRHFAVKNKDDIHKIFIANKKGRQHSIDRINDDWYINGAVKISDNVAKNLVETISKMEMKFIPAEAAKENIINEIAAIGLKVEIYGKEDKKLKTYYIGGSTPDERGSYFLMEGGNQPYVMGLSTIEGGIRGRFIVDEEGWRDKTVFKEKADDIKKLSLDFPKSQKRSFLITNDDSKFKVEPLHQFASPIERPLRKGIIKGYLQAYDRIIAEAFVNDLPEKDSIRGLLPYVVFEIERKDGSSDKISLFPLIDLDNKNINTKDPETNKFVERYYADVNGKDFILVQDKIFRKLIWGYDYFFEK